MFSQRGKHFEKESLTREEKGRGGRVMTSGCPYLHHGEVTPEEVLQSHKLFQAEPVLCHAPLQLRPTLQQCLDLCPHWVHPLWAQLLQLRSPTLQLLHHLRNGIKVNLRAELQCKSNMLGSGGAKNVSLCWPQGEINSHTEVAVSRRVTVFIILIDTVYVALVLIKGFPRPDTVGMPLLL